MKKTIILLALFLNAILLNAQWTNINSSTTKNLNSIYFINQNKGFIVGDSGIVLKTENGGTDWQVVPSDTINHLYKVYFINENKGFVLGSKGLLMITENGGTTWTSKNVGNEYTYFCSINFVNDSIGYMGGCCILNGWYRSAFLRTTDGGNNWTKIYSGAEGGIFDIHIANDSSIYIVQNFTYRGLVLKSTNYGVNFTQLYRSETDAFTTLYIKNDTILTTGECFDNTTPNMLKFSTNDFISSSTYSNITGYSMHCFDTKHLYLVGKEGKINYFNNGEVVVQPSNTNNNLKDVLFLNQNKGFVVGRKGTILKTENGGGSTKIENNENKIDFSVYPNPTKDLLTINIDNTLKNSVLIIYNTLGTEIMKINGLNSTKTIDISNLNNNLYYIKIINGDKSSVKTFIKQ